MDKTDIVVINAGCKPFRKLDGRLKSISSIDLGGMVVKEARKISTHLSLLMVTLLFTVLFSGCTSTAGLTGLYLDEVSTELGAATVLPWENGMRTDPTSDSFEWWYFDASFSDGSTAVVVFFTKSMLKPSEKANPSVSIVITDPNGKKISRHDFPGIDNFEASVDTIDVKTGNNFVKGDLSKIVIHFEKDDVKADLTFTSKVPASRGGSGKLYYDSNKEKYFAWLAAIPFGEVEGSLVYDDKEMEVTGEGYHDHNWGNVSLNKVMTQWYWGRAKIDEYTLIFSEMLASPKFGSVKIPVIYLSKGKDLLSPSHFETMDLTASKWVRHSGGRDYPEKIIIDVAQKKTQIKLRITDPVILEEMYFLEDERLQDAIPWYIRSIARIFTKPCYLRFNAKFDLDIASDTGTVRKTGAGIYELMLLQGKQTVR